MNSIQSSASFGSLASSDDLPLETNMKRPLAFTSQTITSQKQFLVDAVLYPKGIEHPTNFCLGRSTANAAVRAPYPCGSKLTASATSPTAPKAAAAGDSTSPRSPGTPPGGFGAPRNATSPTTNLLRQGLGAFLTANGIVHLDLRHSAHFSGGTLAESLLEELRDNVLSNSLATEASSQTSPEASTGPSGSRRSRAIAVTLLLPSAIAGRQQANESDLSLLDAFALIAQAPLAKQRGTSKELTVDEVARTWPSLDVPTSTTSVRMTVVAGTDDVTSYLSTIGIRTSGTEWFRSAGLCISYVNFSRKLRHELVQVSSSTQPTLKKSVKVIQEAASALQVASKHQLVLPFSFVTDCTLDTVITDRATEPTSAFLDFQRELQQRFYNLHLCEPFVELAKSTLSTLDFYGGHRFVRIVPRNVQQFRDEDPSHAIGILLSSHEPTLESYLRRCRAETPRQPCTGVWPPYSLLDPENEEPSANITVLWFKPEIQCIGGDLSLFGPRPRIGAPVTELANSCINRLVPSLAPVERLLAGGNWILPVTRLSVLPANGPYAQTLYNSFAGFMKATIDRLAGIDLPPTMFDDEEELRPTTPMEAETRAYLGHVLGLQVGHPATALGEIYSAMQLDAKHGRIASSAFHTLVTAGLFKYGEDCNVETLFQLCLDAMETDAGAAGEAAGGSSSVVVAIAPQPSETDQTDDLEHLLANAESRAAVFELARLSNEARVDVPLVANPDDDADLRWQNMRSILVAAWKVQKTGDLDEHMKANPKFRSRVEKKRAKLVSNPEETWTQLAGTLLACCFDENYDVFLYDGKRVLRRIDRSATTMEAPTVYDLVPEVAVSKLLALKKKPCVMVLVEEGGVAMIPPIKKKKRERASVKVEEVEEVVGGA